MGFIWAAFGSIGGTVGAHATAAAVIVALWQTKYIYKKKLKLTFTNNITIVPDKGSTFYNYIGVTVINIGNRDVVIQNWGFDLDDGTQMIIVPDTASLGRVLQVQLPYRFQIKEGTTLYYERRLFHKALKESISNRKL